MNARTFLRLALLSTSCSTFFTFAALPSVNGQTAETANQGAHKVPIATPLKWKSSGVLIKPISDESHTIVSVKDPTVVYYDGLWHIYYAGYFDYKKPEEGSGVSGLK